MFSFDKLCWKSFNLIYQEFCFFFIKYFCLIGKQKWFKIDILNFSEISFYFLWSSLTICFCEATNLKLQKYTVQPLVPPSIHSPINPSNHPVIYSSILHLSIQLSFICPAIQWFIHLFLIHSFIDSPNHPSTHQSIHLLIYLAIHPFKHPSIQLPIHPSVHPLIQPPVHSFTHPTVHSSINLSHHHVTNPLLYSSIHHLIQLPSIIHLLNHPPVHHLCINPSTYLSIHLPSHPSIQLPI